MHAPSSNIKFIVLDVDGVLTDGGMYYTSAGEEFKKFNVRDGIAIKKLPENGIEVGLLSSGLGKSNLIVARRAEMLGVRRVYTGNEPKEHVLRKWMEEMGISPEDTAYIGDDVNDLGCIKLAGFTACPSDAVDIVKKSIKVVLTTKGGEGCVREFVDKYLAQSTGY